LQSTKQKQKNHHQSVLWNVNYIEVTTSKQTSRLAIVGHSRSRFLLMIKTNKIN